MEKPAVREEVQTVLKAGRASEGTAALCLAQERIGFSGLLLARAFGVPEEP